MAYSDSQRKATAKYMSKLHRISIDVKEEKYQDIKSFADSKDLSVRALVLQALEEKMERDS